MAVSAFLKYNERVIAIKYTIDRRPMPEASKALKALVLADADIPADTADRENQSAMGMDIADALIAGQVSPRTRKAFVSDQTEVLEMLETEGCVARC